MLDEGQMAIRMEMMGDVILPVDKVPVLLGRIVIGNEKRCFLHDPQFKKASTTRNGPQSPRKQIFLRD
ncbi:hypothetical protein TNCV_4005791 [Trichonephila clavipes]|nr:hypothetical protein TNCV_4005791 [Trichonephila clavipes]